MPEKGKSANDKSDLEGNYGLNVTQVDIKQEYFFLIIIMNITNITILMIVMIITILIITIVIIIMMILIMILMIMMKDRERQAWE